MKKIKKAVILAAGYGTRMLPAAKSLPKEMLPIVDKPSIQFLVEEAAASGMKEILIITCRDKHIIEDYFDNSPEYENILNIKNKTAELEMLRGIADIADIHFIRQHEAKGLGHAVMRAEAFTAGEDFAVIYGDDVIISETPVCAQLAELYEKMGGGVAIGGVSKVSPEKISSYCSLKVDPIDSGNRDFYVSDMIEKPSPENVMSYYSILGRVILTSEIFDYLRKCPPGHGGEIQLTDAMRAFAVANPGRMLARVFEGERHDMGSKAGFLRANVMEGLKHPETRDEFRKFLTDFAKNNL